MNDTPRRDDPQLDTPQFDSPQFDTPAFDARRFESADTSTVVRSSGVVAIGTALSRLTGFVRIAAIAYALGVTALAGTYSYANETPNIVYELLLGGVLTATLVPLFVRHFETHDDDAASAVFTVSILALVALTAVGVLIAPWIVDLYTLRVHGPDLAAQQELATKLLRLFMPQMLFYGIATLATAMLNARRRFAAAAFAPALNNIVVIAAFLMLARITSGPLTVHRVLDDNGLLLLMGLGTTAGIVVMALALLPALARAHVHLRYLPALRHPAVVTLVRVSGWTVGYVVANQIALFVVTVLGNGTPGGPFVYVSAYAFFQLPHGLLAVSLATTFAPELASAASRSNLDALREQLSRGLRLTAVVIAPAAALYLGLARPLVVALLQRGAFSAGDAIKVADTLAGFAVGLLPFSLYLFTLRAFTSRLNTFTPFWINCVENAVNIALAFPLYAWLGIPGLALAFSLAYFVAAALAFVVLHHDLRGIDGRRLASTVVRVVVAALVVTAVTWGITQAIGWSSTGEALLASVVGLAAGAGVYLGLLVLFRVDELRLLGALLPRRARV
ncbi:MAG TPA: murein biosynthesis integral membrane protein MurJ [Acidimicrobiia bacterium]|nr:murein biosynthesis integral membrane protein MurJ [Acidimicrobiia bacterium]